MKSKKSKLIIIGALILCIIVSIIIFFSVQNEDIEEYPTEEIPQEGLEYIENYTGKVNTLSRGELGNVKSILNKFYLYCSLLNLDNQSYDDIVDEGEDTTKEVILSMISDECRDTAKIEEINEFEDYYLEIYNVYVVTDFENMSVYYINGALRDKDDCTQTKEINVALGLDLNNYTFEIYLDDYVSNVDIVALNAGQEVDFELKSNIENREYNVWSSSSTIISDFLTSYTVMIKNLLLYDTQKAYSFIYENSSISSLEELESFVEENKKDIILMSYGSYELSVDGDYEVFTIYDKRDIFYINLYFNNYSTFAFDIDYI